MDNAPDPAEREQCTSSASPTMETPAHMTSFIKNNSTTHEAGNTAIDNEIKKIPILNDREWPYGCASSIPEEEPNLGM